MSRVTESSPHNDPIGSELGRNSEGDLYFSRVFHFDKSLGKKPQFYTVNVEMIGESWLREQGFSEGDRIFSEQVWHLQNQGWLYTKKGTLPRSAPPTSTTPRPKPTPPVRPTTFPIQRPLSWGGSGAVRPSAPSTDATKVAEGPNRLRMKEVKPFWYAPEPLAKASPNINVDAPRSSEPAARAGNAPPARPEPVVQPRLDPAPLAARLANPSIEPIQPASPPASSRSLPRVEPVTQPAPSLGIEREREFTPFPSEPTRPAVEIVRADATPPKVVIPEPAPTIAPSSRETPPVVVAPERKGFWKTITQALKRLFS